MKYITDIVTGRYYFAYYMDTRVAVIVQSIDEDRGCRLLYSSVASRDANGGVHARYIESGQCVGFTQDNATTYEMAEDEALLYAICGTV